MTDIVDWSHMGLFVSLWQKGGLRPSIGSKSLVEFPCDFGAALVG